MGRLRGLPVRQLAPALQQSQGRSLPWSGATLINCFAERSEGDKAATFDLKSKPQVPGLPHIINPSTGLPWKPEGTEDTWEPRHEYRYGVPESKEPHYRAILDDKGRIMVMICHNTDLGDGWEREGEYEYYFREYSEKKAFPIGINIIFYAMTH